MESLSNRLAHAWTVFRGLNQEPYEPIALEPNLGFVSSINPVTFRGSSVGERSIIATVTTRIALDVASFNFQHVKVDKDGNYTETFDDSLNQCLTIEANKDQTGRAFIMDLIQSMFDEGVVAIVPTETNIDPLNSNSYDILGMRTAKILEWYPDHVRVEMYNDQKGIRERILLPKNMVGIIENPLYTIMNEPNSTYKRLVRAISLLDVTDEKNNSGKLDLIIQLPYTVRSEKRTKEATDRVKTISDQLAANTHGIAYADSTERIIQLNRPVENNLLAKVQYLTNLFYNQLGMSEAIFNGTASSDELQQYYDRSVEPFVTAIVDEFKRKFLTKTARTQGHSIMAFRDIFRLIPASELANVTDVFSRNEVFSPNDFRQILGRKPLSNPEANIPKNRNMPDKSIPNQTPPKAPKQKDDLKPSKDYSKEELQKVINRLQNKMKATQN